MKMAVSKILNRNSPSFYDDYQAKLSGQDFLHFEYTADLNKATYIISKYLTGKFVEISE